LTWYLLAVHYNSASSGKCLNPTARKSTGLFGIITSKRRLKHSEAGIRYMAVQN